MRDQKNNKQSFTIVKGVFVDENVQIEILDRLNKISENLSLEKIKTSPSDKFSESIYYEIQTITENIEKIRQRLDKIEKDLLTKDQ